MTDPDIQKSLDVIAARWPDVDKGLINFFWRLLPRAVTATETATLVDLAILRYRTLLPGTDSLLSEREAAADVTDRLANVALHFLTRMFCASALADNFQLLAHALTQSYETNYRDSHDGREPPQLAQMKQVVLNMEAVVAAAKTPDVKFKN